MTLRREEVRRIASLARLDLTPAEEERFTHQLAQIIDYFDQLQDVAPSSAAEESPDVGLAEAEDLAAPCLPRDTFLANAPESFDGFLMVPRVKSAVSKGAGIQPGAVSTAKAGPETP